MRLCLSQFVNEVGARRPSQYSYTMPRAGRLFTKKERQQGVPDPPPMTTPCDRVKSILRKDYPARLGCQRGLRSASYIYIHVWDTYAYITVLLIFLFIHITFLPL